MTTQSRHASITHHIRRLENRLKALYQVERRFAWYRLIAFLSGALLTWAAASYFGALAGWFALGLSAGVFFTVVAFHRRLDKWIDKLKIWQELKINQSARLMLDWDNLPQPAVIPEHERCTLDVDLDLFAHVVRVDAVIAPATSFAPTDAASSAARPSSSR